MGKANQADKYFAIRLFQEETNVPFKAGGWQKFNSLENSDYHTRPWLEITTDCPSCIGTTVDYNVENTYEGLDGANGSPLHPGGMLARI